MNGQMYQIASIVAAGKRAMQTAAPIQYTPAKYENSCRFVFLPQKAFWRTKQYTAPNVSEWFERLKKNGLQDIKLLCPYAVKDRQRLGFSNTTASSILCFFQNGTVTYFVADWQFDPNQREWNVLYSEYVWPNPPAEKPCFENNTASFRKVLLEIQAFAAQIECEGFAQTFGAAIKLLDGANECPDAEFGVELPQVPKRNLEIFEAASRADVFGAMGSWNDSPPYLAHEKGLDKEYESLSAELLTQVRLAMLYAINEW